MSRPPFGSPEWLPYFEEIVRTSKTTKEAVSRLGYSTPTIVYYHLKKFGIERPPIWSERPWLREFMQRNIPQVIIPTTTGRRWVAGLTQGEGCFQARFYTQQDVTYLNLDVSMADPEPIFKFSDYVGLPHPSKPVKNHDWKPNWHKNACGLRALRVLQEIHPFLLGEKLKEAEKALSFFSPYGGHSGCFGNLDVWPRSEFPWRTKKRGGLPIASDGKAAPGLGLKPPLAFETVDRRVQNLAQCDRQEFHNRSDLMNQWKVPEVIIESIGDRVWVGGLVQGEVRIGSHYTKTTDSTTVDLDLKMTDPHPVFQFADLCGLARPDRAKERPFRWQPIWRKGVAGIRALRILKEIEPYLVGQKLREAQRAFEFFNAQAYRRGCFYASSIWPPHEFPFRRHPLKEVRTSQL